MTLLINMASMHAVSDAEPRKASSVLRECDDHLVVQAAAEEKA